MDKGDRQKEHTLSYLFNIMKFIYSLLIGLLSLKCLANKTNFVRGHVDLRVNTNDYYKHVVVISTPIYIVTA